MVYKIRTSRHELAELGIIKTGWQVILNNRNVKKNIR